MRLEIIAEGVETEAQCSILLDVLLCQSTAYAVDLEPGAYTALAPAHACVDPLLGVVFWAINRPAEKRYFAITPHLSVPVGNYDKNKALNLGENRWKFGLNSGVILPVVIPFTALFVFAVAVTAGQATVIVGGLLSALQ